jgi:hypothetical protein
MSRGFIVDQALTNFESRPLTVIEFDASDSATHAFKCEVDPFTGLPVAAANTRLMLGIVPSAHREYVPFAQRVGFQPATSRR